MPLTHQRWLITGLGNPGRAYQETWHNAGYQVLDQIASTYSLSFNRERFNSQIIEISLDGSRCLLLKPLTYMNRSGEAVAAAVRYFNIPLSQCLVVYDDIDLPFGTLRIRSNGGPGTHNGMRSVIDELQDRSFPRIRIGIGPKNEQMDLADYVLSKVPRDRRENWQQVINQAADAAIITIKKGLETAMQTYNKRTDEESEDSELLQS